MNDATPQTAAPPESELPSKQPDIPAAIIDLNRHLDSLVSHYQHASLFNHAEPMPVLKQLMTDAVTARLKLAEALKPA